jgi:hypothetical protein
LLEVLLRRGASLAEQDGSVDCTSARKLVEHARHVVHIVEITRHRNQRQRQRRTALAQRSDRRL